MKTIKIFLASSEELDYDRMAFGNLIRRLDDLYEKRGIRIKLFEWEDYDAAFNDRRKQDEYNDHVRESDVFLALFYKKAGEFTIEEFDVASEEFKQHASPKVFTFCKDLQPGEEESPELTEFKKRLFEEMGHYWCRYDTRESLQLQFVMQLQLVESSQMGELKVENGNVTMDGIRIAPMDKLRFAAANEDYVKMQTEMFELHEEIEGMQLYLEKKQQKLEKKKAKLEKDPDDEEYQEEYNEVKEEVEELVDKLQPKLNKYNKLKEDFEQLQQLLFNTAKRVAQLQGELITERMRRAMDAFSEGKVREANIILDEAEADAKHNLEDYKQSKEITELKRQAVISSIEELQLKASTVMADASIPIDERIKQTEQIYMQADEMAKETEYDKEKYGRLLRDYQVFLTHFGKYGNAAAVGERLIVLLEAIYGTEHGNTISTYINTGLNYYKSGNPKNACDCLFKAVIICERMDKEGRPDTASLYDAIGFVHDNLGHGNIKQALTYYKKALKIREKTLGPDHLDTANSYNNIGIVNAHLNRNSDSLIYFKKALKIYEKKLGTTHPVVASIYNSIGMVYNNLKEFEKALKSHDKAFKVYCESLGYEHPYIAIIYDNIGNVYFNMNNPSKALDYYNKALTLRIKVLGTSHPDTASSFCTIGSVHETLNDDNEAFCYYQKALEIQETTLGPMHPKTALLYEKKGLLLEKQGDYSKALETFNKAMEVFELFGEDHPYLYNLIGSIYIKLGNNLKAIEYYRKTVESLSLTDDFENHPWKIEAKQKIAELERRIHNCL